jgi:Fur family ferric uptake transcriptional regulator
MPPGVRPPAVSTRSIACWLFLAPAYGYNPGVGAKAAGEQIPGEANGPWRSYLRKKGFKTTQQREAIVDAFLRSSGHVALDDLLARARRTHPGVGLATVYRTVKLLEEAGLAASRQFESGHTLYEVAQGRAHHDHLICQQCGYIVEFESDEIERLQTAVARRMGFNVLRHRHELFGLCEKAQGNANGRCPGEDAAARKPPR